MDQPALHHRAVLERVDPLPGGDERLLDRVGGKVVATEDEAGRPMELVERGSGEIREGLVVAVPGPEDEISVHLPPV